MSEAARRGEGIESSRKDLQEPRGGEAVRTALLDAAAELLAEVGPEATSVRDVARRAGVNHGQVHHYFGGKRGLLEAAMRGLAHDHHAFVRERRGDAAYPPPLLLAQDPGPLSLA